MSIKIDPNTQKAVDPESINKPIKYSIVFMVAVAACVITLKVLFG